MSKPTPHEKHINKMTRFQILKAAIGETLIRVGYNLASPVWSNHTLMKFNEFVRALGTDVNSKQQD